MSTPDPILEDLNPAQREAVSAEGGPLLVIAGAGSGKTRVITHRIAYLVRSRGVPPWQIFAATFTNKAAGEMRRRLEKSLPGVETARLSIGTFHSICVSILRQESARVGLNPRFTIADESDQKALIKDCLRILEIEKNVVQPDDVRDWISSAKTLMYTPEEAQRELQADWGEAFARVYALYEERLQKNNAVDFEDLLLKVVRLFQSQPDVLSLYQDRWKYYLVDEYQDINQVQFELIRLLAGRDRNLCVVGDEDQSIYSWRGADIDNILKFPSLFEGTRAVRLEQNYRSTETILKAANAVIARNTQRLGKNLWSERGAGEPLTLFAGSNEREEAALIIDTIQWLHRLIGARYRDIAIFYRINALSRLFEDYLRQTNIPYRVVGGIRFYDRSEIKDLLAYLRLIVNPLEDMSLCRIINRPRRGIGEKTMTKLLTDSARNNVPLGEHLSQAVKDGSLPKRARAGIADLNAMLEKWRSLREKIKLTELLDEVLQDTRYEERLGDPEALETLTRMENIEELRRALQDFATESPDAGLEDYLEMVTLATSLDDMNEEDDCVSLMTLHSAKGLEFSTVFLAGLEESIFPNPRAISEAGNMEEERRLFYVGLTRAKDRIFLSRADSRNLHGRVQYNPPSTFLLEIPGDLTQSLEEGRLLWDQSRREEPESLLMRGSPPGRTLAEASAGEGGGEAAPEPGLFPLGCRVKHSTLGQGEVVATKGEGQRRKISIRFDAGFELEVLELYGGLELVEELPF